MAICAVDIDERVHTAMDQNLLNQAYHNAMRAVVQALLVTAKETGLGIREVRGAAGLSLPSAESESRFALRRAAAKGRNVSVGAVQYVHAEACLGGQRSMQTCRPIDAYQQ